MGVKNYYEILGVEKTATKEEIKKKYRELCKLHHPDKGGDENLFKEISEAYDVLYDEEKRKNYDYNGSNNRNFFFNDIFNNEEKEVIYGENITLEVKLNLEEIFNGVNKQYTYKRKVKCSDCNGNGGLNVKKCVACDGNGKISKVLKTPIGFFQQTSVCSTCNGIGNITTDNCITCNGSGLKENEELINVNIPKSVYDNMGFVMSGKGNAVKGGEYGDLYIKIIQNKHPKFERFHSDLKFKYYFSYPQLVLGDKIDIETIDGSKIRVTIPKGTDIGTQLKISGKGLYDFNGPNRGDLYILVNLNVPKEVTEQEKLLLEELKKMV